MKTIIANLLAVVTILATIGAVNGLLPFPQATTTEKRILFSNGVSNGVNGNYSWTCGGTSCGLAVTVRRNPDLNGWDLLEFTPEANLLANHPMDAWFAVGFAEGGTTYNSIFNAYTNLGSEVNFVTGQVKTYLEQQYNFTVTQSQTTSGPNAKFNQQLAKQLQWLKGLAAGYAASIPDQTMALSEAQLYLLSIQTEVGNWVGKVQQETRLRENKPVEELFDSVYSKKPYAGIMPRFLENNQHCSALVKLVRDFKGQVLDVVFSHDTWSSFNTMLRQWKTYNMETTVTMSSYPGSLSSIDDWYMTSNQLAVQETTNGFYNNSLYQFITTNTVPEFHRVMIANFLAKNGSEWVDLFSTLNSGTYNNQYMVADMKLVTPGLSSLPANTFWVAEQMPGNVTSADMTNHLNSEGYWASFNIPYFKNVYDLSGFAAQKKKYGSFWSYTQYARPVIFKREHHNVFDIPSMLEMMRFNKFFTDPASLIPWCQNGTAPEVSNCTVPMSSMLSIASRGDLMPDVDGHYYYGPSPMGMYVGPNAFGAIDTKITSYSRMGFINTRKNTGVAICGPTYMNGDTPVFSWSAFVERNPSLNAPHQGVPDTFNFPATEFDPRHY